CVKNKMRHRQSCWTFIDYIEITSVSLFLISWTLRLAVYFYKDISNLMNCAVVLFSVDFMLFCIFTLEFCYVSKTLGPRLIVIPKM
ncbi:transient receptor potential cation channel subfamily M member 1 isoform X1, partial [Biomphalaria glabrata]